MPAAAGAGSGHAGSSRNLTQGEEMFAGRRRFTAPRPSEQAANAGAG